MEDQHEFTSSNAKGGQAGSPKDDAFYHDVLSPVGVVTPSPAHQRMVLEWYQSPTYKCAPCPIEPCELTTDIASGLSLVRASLLRDKSGGSISTLQSDECEEWKGLVELPRDHLSRISLCRDFSGCSSMGTPWSFVAPKRSLENFSALDPIFPASDIEQDELCTERRNRSNRDQYMTTHIPGFTSPWEFKRMLLHGACSVDPLVIGHYASANIGAWTSSSTGTHGIHLQNHSVWPFSRASVPDDTLLATDGPKNHLVPTDSPISQALRLVHEQHHISAKATANHRATARVAPEIDIVSAPSPPCSEIYTAPMRKKQSRNPVPVERIYVLDGFRDNDVLCGKGERINQHYGHKLFHKEKVYFQAQYKQTTIKKENTALVEKLLKTMTRKYGSRFLALCPEKQQWYMISHERALGKAKQVLRESFTSEQRRQKRQRYFKPASTLAP